ncbi:unnamed protein product [Meganyctiphanes norvegica]|uniref:Mannosyltransferase n=1 Tax=Meganyctiphanes norvegica TaxID=48144 RepID=A0AAV2Q8M2_MEGNR
MARDMLDIDAPKPWEYNSTNPIRSVSFSAVVSLPYVALKFVAPYCMSLWSWEVLTPYNLLVAPRFYITMLSFIVDFCVYRIACLCYIRPWKCMEVFASSYVMLVYATRTFSNTVELILMAVLLWRVCESMVDSTKIMRKQCILDDLYQSVERIENKVKLKRLKSKLPPYNYGDSFTISVIATYGLFVRPTFVIFSFVPIAYWLQRGVVSKEVDFSYFNMRAASLVPGIVLTFFGCVLLDSFYYGSVSFEEIMYWNLTAASFTVTPFNFILYNVQGSNLAQHGLHPHFLHLVVNIPIVHGVLGMLGLWSVTKWFVSITTHRISKKPKVTSMATMLLLTFIFPVMVLSLIPHQEPRFIIPTLIPLVLLHSDQLILWSIPKFKFMKHFLFVMWHTWNMFAVVIFGFLHQGGVTNSMIRVHKHISEQPAQTSMHILFAHMYTPPTFLLMRKMWAEAETDLGGRYRIGRYVHTYTIGGAHPPDSFHDIAATIHQSAVKNSNTTKQQEVIICLPASLTTEFLEYKPENVSVKHIERIRGHLTLEDPPDLSLQGVKFTEKCGQLCHLIQRIDQFSIDIFLIKYDQSFNYDPIYTSNFAIEEDTEEYIKDKFENVKENIKDKSEEDTTFFHVKYDDDYKELFDFDDDFDDEEFNEELNEKEDDSEQADKNSDSFDIEESDDDDFRFIDEL